MIFHQQQASQNYLSVILYIYLFFIIPLAVYYCLCIVHCVLHWYTDDLIPMAI